MRSFYFDLSAWALQDPARWAAWVAPCPVPQRELRGIAGRRKVTEETACRTRQRQPLPPRLIDQAEHDHLHYVELLNAGQAAASGQAFPAGGGPGPGCSAPADVRREREHGRANVRLRESGSAKVVHVGREEGRAFWDWAIIETLRLSGIRIEEFLEISQLSIRQYQSPSSRTMSHMLVILPFSMKSFRI